MSETGRILAYIGLAAAVGLICVGCGLALGHWIWNLADPYARANRKLNRRARALERGRGRA